MGATQAPVRNPLAWLDRPSDERGVSFLHHERGWQLHTYDELAASVSAAAADIAAAVEAVPGERVVPIVLSSGPEFIAAFFGALRSGCAPCPVAPPSFLQDESTYVRYIAAIFAAARPAALVTEAEFTDVVASAARRAGVDRAIVQPGSAGRGMGAGSRARSSLALVQFTSGSTGRPRGVRVGRENLEANLGMMERWVRLGPDDRIASWLPLYHDMGLIGTLLTPVTLGLDALVILPEQFVAEPRRWLECFGRHGATTTASPSFGFAYAAKRLRPSDIAGLDLSGWRIAIAGAERLDPGAMARFAQLAAPAGFRSEAFVPAYGMAEATLAVTGVPPDEVPTVVKFDWGTVRMGEAVSVLDVASIDDVERIGDGVGWAVDCGAPLAGVSVAVVGDDGEQLPDGHLGEIVVAGPAVARGYCDDGRSTDTRLGDGVVKTGDAGILRGDRLFVLGRIADGVSLRGRNVYAEDLEAAIASVDGVSRGRCAVFTGMGARAPAIVAVVESEPGPWVARVGRLLARAARDDASVYVMRAERGTILRTSSGKPRRRAMFADFLQGTLRAEVTWTNGASPPIARESRYEPLKT
jgi:fatty-acyl-CoA synthase